MSTDEYPRSLQFVPFSSVVETGFWHKFSQLKLDEFRLKDDAVSISGHYSNTTSQNLPPFFNVDFEAFTGRGMVAGHLINYNTVEQFRACDKAAQLQQAGHNIWQSIRDGRALQDPSLLNTFLVLMYADLKRFDFMYWFGFPALRFPGDIQLIRSPVGLADVLSTSQRQKLAASVESLSRSVSSVRVPVPFFMVCFSHGVSDAVGVPDDEVSATAEPLARMAELRGEFGERALLAMEDPASEHAHPGWPLRNLLALYWHTCGREYPNVRVLCWRSRSSSESADSHGESLIFNLHLQHPTGSAGDDDQPVIVGWERNERGRAGPRHVNLASSMDPKQLVLSAVDLNVKLMRWRVAPRLDTNLLARAKCLLIGAGTLGCNVARSLLGWGVRSITLVDNGVVSLSNPARQSLFVAQDAFQRRYKAEAAADRLTQIHPAVTAVGEILTVPMPGHPVLPTMRQEVLSEIGRLQRLVETSDVVFLLVDSREGRWLPTLITSALKKITITAALGFDSYLVMRHGIHVDDDKRLGCYFCNDVVGPTNSLIDRTLDQQCTVTRPGLSQIASGLAVEMAVSLLQHPLGGGAPVLSSSVAGAATSTDQTSGVLGSVPHSVRGFLADNFSQIQPYSPAFDRCPACSSSVIDRYCSADSDEFLLRVFNEPEYLEQTCGLAQLQHTVQNLQLTALGDSDTDENEPSEHTNS